MKHALEWILGVITRVIIWRHKPHIVAVVGSVGKTSAKEAVFQVLSSQFSARKAEGSYNNEIGVPLTAIGSVAQGKSLVGWALVFVKSVATMIGFDGYPKVLVLEFGEGKPGDIKYLMELMKPRTVVLTAIENVHTEFFKNMDGVAKELLASVRMLAPSDSAIVNADNERIAKSVPSIKASVATVSLKEDADITIDQIRIIMNNGVLGLQMKILHQGTVVPIFLPGVIAKHQAYAVMLACGVGLRFGMNMVDIGKALEKYRPPKGRTSVIEGLHGSTLVDDTYNASPVASIAALSIFEHIPMHEEGKKIAIFGDMLELGDFAEQGHRDVGHKVAEAKVDHLVTVGDLARMIAEGARQAGMHEEHIHTFRDQSSAISFAQELIKKNDVILVKGSQGARMERVVKMLMNDPRSAEDLLVRQSRQWQQKA